MKLYKYISVNNQIIDGIFKDHFLKFAPAHKLNDPFELKPIFKGFFRDEQKDRQYQDNWMKQYVLNDVRDTDQESFRKAFLDVTYKRTSSINQEVTFEEFCDSPIKYFHEEAYQKISLPRWGVFSLCERKNNLLMWAHYADEHKGMVVELDKHHIFFKQNRTADDIESVLKKVKYTFIRPEVHILENDDREKILFTKSRHWKYEKEWRAIRILEKCDKMIENMHLFQFEPTLITGLYFGMRMPREVKKKIIETAKLNYSPSHLKIYDSRLNKTKYQLDFEEITDWDKFIERL